MDPARGRFKISDLVTGFVNRYSHAGKDPMKQIGSTGMTWTKLHHPYIPAGFIFAVTGSDIDDREISPALSGDKGVVT